MSFSFITVASKLHDPHHLAQLMAEHTKTLVSAGGGVLDGSEAVRHEGAIFVFVQTGGVENEVLRWVRSRIQQGRKCPVLLIAHDAHNSLPAALEILAQVQQENGTGRIYFLRSCKDSDTISAMVQTARCLEANRRLAADRFGQIGESSDWLVASSHRPEVVCGRFGCKWIPLSVDELRAHIARDPAPTLGNEFEVWEQAKETDGVTRETFARTVGVFRGLKALVNSYQLNALTLRCFDLVIQDSTTGCLALSRLADEGISAGCEGDVPSILLLRWLWHLTGRTGWMANPSAVNVQTGELLLAHCTVPLSMVGEHRLKTHFESGLGIGIDGTFAPGPVTLLRLGGANLDRAWVAEGVLTQSTHAPHLCRTQAQVQLEPAMAEQLLTSPLGNHVILIPGHIRALFEEAMGLVDKL